VATTIPRDELGPPSADELALAEYKLGSFVSDLNDFADRAEKALERTVPLDDAVFMSVHGIAVDDEPAIDDATLTSLIFFFTEALADAKTIAQTAANLQEGLLALRRARCPSAEVERLWASGRAWHREAAQGKGV
jgi:hypothetical protein